MRVRMKVAISGTRDGESWPARGGVVDLPDEEARHMIAGGLAVEDDGAEEHATVPGSPEKATGRKPAAKPAAQK
jgi:hypothetical protein